MLFNSSAGAYMVCFFQDNFPPTTVCWRAKGLKCHSSFYCHPHLASPVPSYHPIGQSGADCRIKWRNFGDHGDILKPLSQWLKNQSSSRFCLRDSGGTLWMRRILCRFWSTWICKTTKILPSIYSFFKVLSGITEKPDRVHSLRSFLSYRIIGYMCK